MSKWSFHLSMTLSQPRIQNLPPTFSRVLSPLIVITPIILTENLLNLKEEAKSFCKVQAIETLKQGCTFMCVSMNEFLVKLFSVRLYIRIPHLVAFRPKAKARSSRLVFGAKQQQYIAHYIVGNYYVETTRVSVNRDKQHQLFLTW